MIIRCPECSTGFKLPDERLSEDPIKVRCSKCKEVFRVGLVDGEAVRYDVDGNRLDGGDAGDANETQFGSPGTALGGATGDSDDDSPQDAGSNGGTDGETDKRDERSTQRGTPATSSDASDNADAAEMKAGDHATAADDNSDDQSTADSDDDGARKQTLMGTPAAQPGDDETDEEQDETESSGRSKSSSPDYDPFPHANTGDQSDDADDAVGGLSQASSDAIETSDDEDGDDPFADVLDDEESSDSTAEQSDNEDETDDSETAEDADSASTRGDESGEDSTDQSKKSTMIGLGAQQPGADDDQPASGETQADDTDSDEDADLADIEVGDDIPQDDDSIHQQQQDRQSERQPADDVGTGAAASGATDAGSTVDDEFEQDREVFDPDEGRVRPGDSESSPKGPSSPGLAENSAPSGPPGAAGPPGDGAPTSGAADTGRSSDTTASTASDSDDEPELDTVSTDDRTARQEATPAGRPESDWDVGATDRLDDAAYGSSWFQKFANVLLISLIVVGIGIAVGVVRAGGVYDFNRLSHMLQVTLHGDKFQPRKAWQETQTPVKTGPERDIAFNNVFASPLQRPDEGDSSSDKENKDNRWLIVRGEAKNLTDDPIKDLNVRVMLFDDNDKRIAEATAPLGATISDKKLAELDSLENADFQPSPPASIAPQEAEPFTVIFPSPPKSAFDGSLVSYGVERVE